MALGGGKTFPVSLEGRRAIDVLNSNRKKFSNKDIGMMPVAFMTFTQNLNQIVYL